MSANLEVVRSFIGAWRRNDLDEIMSFFSDDCVYHNMPIDPARGIDAARAMLAGFSGMAREVEWVLHQIAETPAGVVLTERTDRFEIGGRWVELPVMGSFELRAGKITAWRDYFDLAQFQRQLPGRGRLATVRGASVGTASAAASAVRAASGASVGTSSANS